VVSVQKDSKTIVRFDSENAAYNAYATRYHFIDGEKVEIKLALAKGTEFVNKILVQKLPWFVEDGEKKKNFNLSLTVVSEDLLQYFERFGTVVDHVILRDDLGASKGSGYVQFLKEKYVDKVLSRSHTIGEAKVDVRLATKKLEEPSPKIRIMYDSSPKDIDPPASSFPIFPEHKIHLPRNIDRPRMIAFHPKEPRFFLVRMHILFVLK